VSPSRTLAPGPAAFEARFAIRDRVIIDADPSLVARVLAVRFYDGGHEVMVGWIADGQPQESVVDEWRLSHAEGTA
jgi:hypothetical protein